MQRKFLYFVLTLLITGQSLTGCKNPFKEEHKKERVVILLDEPIPESGRYIRFWDGKNDKGKYVVPGKYIVLLEVRDFQDQAFITVLDGGKDEVNFEEHMEPGYWLDFQLQTPYPNPFQVRSGINIPFLVSEPARVKISIYKE